MVKANPALSNSAQDVGETIVNRFLYRPHWFISRQIKIPVLLLNALDDPLVPEELFVTPHNHVSKYR